MTIQLNLLLHAWPCRHTCTLIGIEATLHTLCI